MPATTKLYLPYGCLHHEANGPGTSSGGGDGGTVRSRRVGSPGPVTFHWFHAGRQTPLAPYESLIMGYRGLSAEARERAERVVDEFFSEAEFRALRDYLRARHDDDVRTAILSAPVHPIKADTTTRAGNLRPFMSHVADPVAGCGLCRLCDEEGYSLPFPVCGYFVPALAQSYLPSPMAVNRA